MILTPLEAETIYNSMCALNNINARINLEFKKDNESFNVFEANDGRIHVWKTTWNLVGGAVYTEESYKDQDAFFTAYD